MRRRDFIKIIAASASALPLAARAQQPERVRRVGVLMALAATDAEGQARLAAFLQGLQEYGWAVGRNMQVDIRWAAGNADDIRKYAAELIALAPDVILVSGGTGVGPMLQMTRTVPIVFTQTFDPVSSGFVASLARPSGNATGFTGFESNMGAKWLELLKEIAPGLTRAAVLRDPASPQGLGQLGAIQTAAHSAGIDVRPVNVRNGDEIDDSLDPHRRAAVYADRILKGEKPADMPVQAPTKYDLVINLKTAKALGLTVPRTLLAQASEVIE